MGLGEGGVGQGGGVGPGALGGAWGGVRGRGLEGWGRGLTPVPIALSWTLLPYRGPYCPIVDPIGPLRVRFV